VDGAGNVSKTFLDTVTLDVTGPVVRDLSATPNPFDHHLGQTTTIRFTTADATSGTCPAQLRIRDAGGALVRVIGKKVSCPPGGAAASMTWDGRDTAKALVPAATYTYEILATDRAGNAGAIARDTVTVR
jgi:hypothetical protein